MCLLASNPINAFLLERTSISRSLPLMPAAANDPKKPRLSGWSLKLPKAGVPIDRIICAAGSALFQREMRLLEEVADERGDTFPRELGRATWKKVPSDTTREFAIQLDVAPKSSTLLLETENGDNPRSICTIFAAITPLPNLSSKLRPIPRSQYGSTTEIRTLLYRGMT